MSESISQGNQESLSQEEFESHLSEFGIVHIDEDGQAHAITRDGEGIVPVPNDMAERIALALRTQDKVDSSERSLELARSFAALNCRKTIFAVTGAVTFNEVTDDQHEDIDGLEQLFSDVERIQGVGYEPFVFTEADEKVEEVLDEYEGAFPCVVHLFEYDNSSPLAEAVQQNIHEQGGFLDIETVKKMHRMHSFLVLGEDESGYVCFQKTEPGLQGMIMISGLDMALAHELSPDRTGVAFIGPAR